MAGNAISLQEKKKRALMLFFWLNLFLQPKSYPYKPLKSISHEKSKNNFDHGGPYGKYDFGPCAENRGKNISCIRNRSDHYKPPPSGGP